MEATQIENPDIQNQWNEKRIAKNLRKREALDLHNQRRREKRQGIYNLTSWHASRLRKMEENEIDNYITFITYIKWKGGIPPNENDYQEEFEFLIDLSEQFDSLNGYEFFRKHNLSLPPCGVSMDETFFD